MLYLSTLSTWAFTIRVDFAPETPPGSAVFIVESVHEKAVSGRKRGLGWTRVRQGPVERPEDVH